jgi:hypothetical protein
LKDAGYQPLFVKPDGKMPLYVSPVEKKSTLPKQGTVSPFNYTAWSQY